MPDKSYTRRYCFEHDVEVIDLGIRLNDVREYDLTSEGVHYRHHPNRDLQRNGATQEEIAFLNSDGWGGQRVELNAFTSDVLIDWLESKLEEHGVKKVIPDQGVIEAAYRRAFEIATIRGPLAEITEQAHEEAAEADIPDDLLSPIKDTLDATPSLPWDLAVARIAAGKMN